MVRMIDSATSSTTITSTNRCIAFDTDVISEDENKSYYNVYTYTCAHPGMDFKISLSKLCLLTLKASY